MKTPVIAVCAAFVALFVSSPGIACEALQQSVRDALAKASLVERVILVRVRDFIPDPSSKLVDVEFEADMSFSTKLTKRGIERAMVDGYAAAMTAGCTVVRATMEAQMTFVDSKGNESLGVVYGTSLRGEDAAGVNWDKRHILEWPRIWKVYGVHPAFR